MTLHQFSRTIRKIQTITPCFWIHSNSTRGFSSSQPFAKLQPPWLFSFPWRLKFFNSDIHLYSPTWSSLNSALTPQWHFIISTCNDVYPWNLTVHLIHIVSSPQWHLFQLQLFRRVFPSLHIKFTQSCAMQNSLCHHEIPSTIDSSSQRPPLWPSTSKIAF